MSIKRKILNGGLSLSMTNIAVGAMRFGRVLIAANVLSKGDYGIAALFAMTTMLLMAVSELGLTRLIVQNPRGHDDRFVRMIQLLFFGRGLALGLVIYLFAGPIAGLLNAPEVQWAFEVLALSPVIAGLAHMDVYRFERDLNFKPYIKVTLLTGLALTLCTYPLVRYFMDYRALLALGLLQAVCHTVLTHVVAQRRYGFGFDIEMAPTIYRFGWPILLNSTLMLVIMQGEKFIIAHSDDYNDGMLAEFNIAALLALESMVILSSVAEKMMLPVLARAQDDRKRFLHQYRLCTVVCCGAASCFAAFFGLMGYWVLHLMFDQKYLEASGLVVLLGMQQAIRLTRIGPTVGALALGDSRNSLVTNVTRMMGVVVCYFVALGGGAMEAMVAVAIVSEVVAVVVGVSWLRTRNSIGAVHFDRPFVLMAMFVGLVSWLGTCDVIAESMWVSGGVLVGVLCLIGGGYWVCFKDLRGECLDDTQLVLERTSRRAA